MMLLTILFICFLSQSSLATECKKRQYSSLSFVCVCDANHCDTLDVDQNVDQNSIVSYDTDAYQYRLHKTVIRGDDLKSKRNKGSFTLNVNASDLKQSILGFGGTFTDSTAINIKSLSKNLSDRVMREYFGKNGLEYNMARVPIGGCDASTRAYSLDDNHANDFDLNYFALAEEDVKYRIPLLKRAKEINSEFRIFGSAWAPPAWMKTNGKLNDGGTMLGKPGDKYYKTWANYYVKYLNEYEKNGVTFWGITTQNEPAVGFRKGYPWNAVGLTANNIRDWVKLDLGPALTSAGWGKGNLSLMVNDDNTNVVEAYASAVLDDPEAAQYASGIAYHWYSRNYPSSYQILSTMHQKYPDYFLISSEGGETGVASKYLGAWDRAENYAVDILEGLQHWSTGWTDWSMAVDTTGGPSWAKNWCDAAIVVNVTAQEYYRNPMFYALAHFTKFLPRGSTRIESTVTNAPGNVHTTSFKTPDDKLILILVNTNEKSIDITVNGFYKHSITVTLLPRSFKTLVTNS